MEHSDKLDEIGPALAKAQGEFPAVNPDADGQAGGGRYRYATLGHVFQTVRPTLAANGLSVTQSIEPTDSGITAHTHLLHESGQWIRGSAPVPVEKDTAQGVGSAITYARRYGLSALLGIAVDDDDDGADATARPPKRQQRSSSAPATGPTKPQQNMFYAITKSLNMDEDQIAAGLKHRGYSCKFLELTKKQASEVLDALKEKQDAQ